MEKYKNQEHQRGSAIEKLVAVALVIALSFAYKWCKWQELHELLKQKTEQLDTDPGDTGVLMQRWNEQLFIDYQDQDSVQVYTYAWVSPDHSFKYTIKGNEKDGQWELDGKPLDSQTAIYSLNKLLNEINNPNTPDLY